MSALYVIIMLFSALESLPLFDLQCHAAVQLGLDGDLSSSHTDKSFKDGLI